MLYVDPGPRTCRIGVHRAVGDRGAAVAEVNPAAGMVADCCVCDKRRGVVYQDTASILHGRIAEHRPIGAAMEKKPVPIARTGVSEAGSEQDWTRLSPLRI